MNTTKNTDENIMRLSNDELKSVSGGVLIGNFEYGTDSEGNQYVYAYRIPDGIATRCSIQCTYGPNEERKTREEAETYLRQWDAMWDSHCGGPPAASS